MYLVFYMIVERHFPRGSVDWNNAAGGYYNIFDHVTSLAEVWIEIDINTDYFEKEI